MLLGCGIWNLIVVQSSYSLDRHDSKIIAEQAELHHLCCLKIG